MINGFKYISIIISTRNSEKYIEKCLTSALTQDYPYFDVVFLDAQSTDKTFELAKNFETKYSNLRCFKNDIRKYQGENIRIGVEMSNPGSICCHLDGDDWYPHNMVLQRVNSEYNKTNCWMTYGTYTEYFGENIPLKDASWHYHEYPLDVCQNKTYRQHSWLASHLRTHYRELFLNIDQEDMNDTKTKNYVSFAPDLSFQFPMLEMCPVDKSRYIPDILYVYNRETENNESKQNQSEIDRIEKMLRNKTPYKTIESLW